MSTLPRKHYEDLIRGMEADDNPNVRYQAGDAEMLRAIVELLIDIREQIGQGLR